MTPVISPLAFYLMDIADGLLIVAFLLGLVSVVWTVNTCVERGKPDKRALVLAITSALLFVFVPSKDTATKMLIAQNVTYERVEVATGTVQSVYEDIMGLFEEDDNG